jgi:hypothetical protein
MVVRYGVKIMTMVKEPPFHSVCPQLSNTILGGM